MSSASTVARADVRLHDCSAVRPDRTLALRVDQLTPAHPDVRWHTPVLKDGLFSPTEYYWISEPWGHASSDAARGGPCRHATGLALKVLPWVVEGAGGLGAGKTSGAGTRGVDLNAAVGGRTGYTDTNGGESSNNGSKIHADCYPAENPSL